MLRDAKRQPELDGEDHLRTADEAIKELPSAVQPKPGSKGQLPSAHMGHAGTAKASRPPLPGEGQSGTADKATVIAPSARQPNGDDEAATRVPQGQNRGAKSSPPQGDGAGHGKSADEGHNAIARPSPDISPLTVAARAAMGKTGNDIEKAVVLLMKRAKADPALTMLAAERGFRSACNSETERVRSDVWRGPSHDPRPADPVKRREQVVALAQSNLLTFILPGGVALGDARRDGVEQAAAFYQMQVLGFREKMRWMQLIAAALPNDHTVVRAALDNAALQELRIKAVEVKDAA